MTKSLAMPAIVGMIIAAVIGGLFTPLGHRLAELVMSAVRPGNGELTPPPGTEPGPPPQEPPEPAGPADFENDFLQARVSSLSLSPDGRRATLALDLRNTTAAELGVVLNVDRAPARLVDDRGNSLEAWEVSGLSYTTRWRPEADEFTFLSAGSSTTAVFVLDNRDLRSRRFRDETETSESPGQTFAFSASFYRLEQNRPVQFSIGLSNLSRVLD